MPSSASATPSSSDGQQEQALRRGRVRSVRSTSGTVPTIETTNTPR